MGSRWPGQAAHPSLGLSSLGRAPSLAGAHAQQLCCLRPLGLAAHKGTPPHTPLPSQQPGGGKWAPGQRSPLPHQLQPRGSGPQVQARQWMAQGSQWTTEPAAPRCRLGGGWPGARSGQWSWQPGHPSALPLRWWFCGEGPVLKQPHPLPRRMVARDADTSVLWTGCASAHTSDRRHSRQGQRPHWALGRPLSGGSLWLAPESEPPPHRGGDP